MRSCSGIRLFLCASLLLIMGTGVASAQGQKVTRENREANESERDNPQERAKWFMRGRTVNGKPAPELLHKAYRQKLNNRRLHEAARAAARTSATQASTATPGAAQGVNPSFIQTTGGPSWVALGPAPSGTASPGDDQDYGPAIGRATVVVVDQSDPSGNTVYLGGASGGLWKSTNAADSTVQSCAYISVSIAPYCAPKVSWTPLIDQQATLTVGAMAIRPGNPQWLVVGTGEANNSADSYYGLGFLVSQDGGATWLSLVSTAKSSDGSSTIDLHGLGTTKLAFSTDNDGIVVATMAASSGGIAVGAEFATVGTNTPRGIYFSTDAGLTWQRATVCDSQSWSPPTCPTGSSPDSGSANSVIYNPFTHLFYANVRYHGFYSSPDGQNWTRLAAQPGGSLFSLTACPSSPFSAGCPLYRAEMTVVPGRAGTNAKGEMYVWMVNSSDANEGIFQSLDGGATWTAISITGITNCGDGANGACGTTQGAYNLTLLAVPNGSVVSGQFATEIYAGAVNEFRCSLNSVSNPTCAANPFANLTHTYGNCGTGTGSFSYVHPDEHGIDVSPPNATHPSTAVTYFANDGGIYRTLDSLATTQLQCNGIAQSWIQFDNLSGSMGSMIQFVSFSQHPTDSTILIGGTQDNGSMARSTGITVPVYPNPHGSSWQSVNNGDGGFTEINTSNPTELFSSNPHVNISKCVSLGTSGFCSMSDPANQIIFPSTVGNDGSIFYPAFILDPQAANHMLVGTCRLWRVDRPASNTGSWTQTARLTYNLDEFAVAGLDTCSSSASNMVTAIAAGGPCKGVCNSANNGTGNGSQVIYVGTDAGRVFVTTNADGGAATWIDRTSGLSNSTGCGGTGCPISGIAIDPADPTGNTAYVTVMGFKTGHVFKTTTAGASWTNLDGDATTTGLPDNPADSVAIDPNVTGLLYVGTDVGVFKSLGDGLWTEIGPSAGSGSLPNVATTALRTFGTGANSHLRVSTYGRGIWDISIAPVPTFIFSLSFPSPTPIGQSATINGTITLINGYNNAIQVTCPNLDPSLTCTPPQQILAAGVTSFSIALSGTTTGTYTVNVVAVGADASAHTEQHSVSFTVLVAPDFALTTPATVTTLAGSTGKTNFNVTANATFSGTVVVNCTPPSFGTCTASPSIFALSPSGAANVVVSITPAITTTAGTYSVTLTATSGSISHQTTATVQVLEAPDFSMTQPTVPPVSAGLTTTGTFDVTANTTFNGPLSSDGPITFACPSGLPAGASCAFTPSSVTLQPSQKQTVSIAVQTPATSTPNTYTVAVTAASTSGKQHSQPLSLTVQAASNAFELSGQIQFPNPNVKAGAVLTGASIALRSSAYSGNVTLSCSLASACTVNPASVQLTNGATAPVNISINAFGLPAGNASVTVIAKDASTTFTSAPFAYNVMDYSITAGTTTPILPAGSTTASLSLTAQSGYTGTVTASCSVGTAPVTCSLSPVGPYAVSGTAAVPVTATISGPGSTTTTASGNYTVTVITSDAGFATLAHNASIAVTVQDYKLQTAIGGTQTGSASVIAGQSVSFMVSVVPQAGGFSGTVNFDAAAVCGGLPSKTTCTVNDLSTGQVTVAAGATMTLKIQTTAATTAGLRPLNHPGAPILAFWTMLPGVVGAVFVAGRRRKRTIWALLALMVLLLIALTACGGGGGGSTTAPPPTPIPGTPAGTSTITVTSTSGSGATAMTRTAQITLTVQ